MSKKTKKHPIAPAQYARMLERYAADVTAHRQVMGASHEDRELDLAAQAITGGLAMLGNEQPFDLAAMTHVVGFVQGLFLVKKIRSWEYLASDDRRE